MAIPDETAEIPELYFASGLPGYPDARRFTLVRWEEPPRSPACGASTTPTSSSS